MRRTLMLAATALAATLVSHQSASASPKVTGGGKGTTISISDATSEGAEPAPARGRRSSRPSYKYKVRVLRDGQWCMETRWTRDARRARVGELQGDTYNVLAPAPPDCPRAERTAAARAQQFWDVRVLPSPTLRAEPGWGLAGKPVYLEIVGDRTRTFHVGNPIGPDVVVEATSEYVVDWGDRHNPGTRVTRTRSRGGPWPNGDVTHVYTHVEDVTITVTQHWRATWRAGDQSGTLGELVTRGSLADFRIAQLQAVRRR